MADVSVIVLVGNEALHIRRCLERLAPLEPKQVFIVESQKGDNTHDVAIETARHLQWQVKVKGEGEEGNTSTLHLHSTPTPNQQRTLLCSDRRAMAEMKVAEWLAGVDDEAFEAALQKLVDEKTAAGEYRFKRPEERELAISGARQFYRDFSRKIIPLSDGRYVYFAPDARAKNRNASNAISWAEYAFHAVSSSGKLLDGKNFRERIYNATKAADLPVLESVIRSEQCMYRLIDAYPENDAVIFVGHDAGSGRLEVVTRLDQFGNAEANLGEVTVIAKHKRKENPPPKFRPLTEVVETVAKHQAAGFSPSTTGNNIANPPSPRKGEVRGNNRIIECSNNRMRGESRRIPCESVKSVDKQASSEGLHHSSLVTCFHAWPGNQAAQFNWALDALCASEKGKVKSEKRPEWILRLDADEYLTEPLIARIKAFVAASPENVDLVLLRLGRTWQGRRVRFGMPPKYIPRLFRFGTCRYGDQVMDERLEADPARTIRFKEMFIDDNLNSFDWWREKHVGYMKREAQKAVGGAHGNKGLYYKMPPYLRAIGYWAMRYFVFLGFLDGRAGWSWNFWQGLWYRWQVDREISRL